MSLKEFLLEQDGKTWEKPYFYINHPAKGKTLCCIHEFQRPVSQNLIDLLPGILDWEVLEEGRMFSESEFISWLG